MAAVSAATTAILLGSISISIWVVTIGPQPTPVARVSGAPGFSTRSAQIVQHARHCWMRTVLDLNSVSPTSARPQLNDLPDGLRFGVDDSYRSMQMSATKHSSRISMEFTASLVSLGAAKRRLGMTASTPKGDLLPPASTH